MIIHSIHWRSKDKLPEEQINSHSGRLSSENEKVPYSQPGFWIRFGLIDVTLYG